MVMEFLSSSYLNSAHHDVVRRSEHLPKPYTVRVAESCRITDAIDTAIRRRCPWPEIGARTCGARPAGGAESLDGVGLAGPAAGGAAKAPY
jgi:hypothetical protein